MQEHPNFIDAEHYALEKGDGLGEEDLEPVTLETDVDPEELKDGIREDIADIEGQIVEMRENVNPEDDTLKDLERNLSEKREELKRLGGNPEPKQRNVFKEWVDEEE